MINNIIKLSKFLRTSTLSSSSAASDVYKRQVVGAGSAGCAVANRLSFDKNKSVLLLEAGKSSHPLSRIPVSFALLIDHPTANWRYRSCLLYTSPSPRD